MKRIFILLLAAIMVFAFAACGESETTESSVSEASEIESVADESETEEVSKDESVTVSEDTSEDASENTSEDTSEEVSADTSEETSEEVKNESIYDEFTLGKADKAPTVDGEVTKGEYATVIEFSKTKTHWNLCSTEGAENYDVVLYLSWDETYLYSAVAVKVGMPRTYNNTNFTQERPYIFDRRHVMTAVVTSDPTESKYLPPNGATEWTWSEAYSSGLGSEWTITAQPDGSNICTDHFGGVTQNSGFSYKVGVSKLETEVYEQAIPWTALAGGNNFKAEAGSMIGYAFTACCEEVDISVESDPNAIYASFGGGITTYKNFADYVGFTLVD